MIDFSFYVTDPNSHLVCLLLYPNQLIWNFVHLSFVRLTSSLMVLMNPNLLIFLSFKRCIAWVHFHYDYHVVLFIYCPSVTSKVFKCSLREFPGKDLPYPKWGNLILNSSKHLPLKHSPFTSVFKWLSSKNKTIRMMILVRYIDKCGVRLVTRYIRIYYNYTIIIYGGPFTFWNVYVIFSDRSYRVKI